ncbi:MAG: hypothetical protein A3F17_07670 [Gammaproteobacteria bacterium RIFCSPHIGHO2_12_FULL_41_15]|nr:MAG: hypothetical protein A3F17_07670 [Gammaproteobacteria bacterium RIFCSPHIGHO2_12_FULL_41_15]
MKSISYTQARSNLAETMKRVCSDHAPIIITRSANEPIVMISLEDYEMMLETNYLLQSPANAERLNAAVEEIETLIKKNKKKQINR